MPTRNEQIYDAGCALQGLARDISNECHSAVLGLVVTHVSFECSDSVMTIHVAGNFDGRRVRVNRPLPLVELSHARLDRVGFEIQTIATGFMSLREVK